MIKKNDMPVLSMAIKTHFFIAFLKPGPSRAITEK
jgi:hypothetical protein